ncbi:MAG: hypothetical protein V4474_00350 [Patescibacteria group bacterium]
MELAAQYAKALAEVDKPTMASLRAALERRGHSKLLPRIFAEYEKLQLQKERRVKQQTPSKEQERTRTLLELYKKLVATPN